MFRFVIPVICIVAISSLGCSRSHYRLRADADSYTIVHEKTDCAPWQPESDFTVYPKPHSRLYNNPCVDAPCLPNPSPQLYDYDLPPVAKRDPARFRPGETSPHNETDEAALNEAMPDESDKAGDSKRVGPVAPNPPIIVTARRSPITTVSFQGDQALDISPPDIADDVDTGSVNKGQGEELPVPANKDSVTQQKSVIPVDYWSAVPRECLRRMLEFDTIREEYLKTYGSEPSQDIVDDSPRLALEDIIELTHLNSRELQTQKEALYTVALNLTLERFDYQLKPSTSNNGSAANYRHNRVAGITTDTLSVPTSLQLDRMLWTGGDLLARFGNSVVLTFNGPQGFAADVGSDLFFDVSQSLLQRDIRFEALTQAERNVIYQARDYTRFRKELFVDLATRYYSLIRQFRQIEINTQNYFTLVREFRQTQEEFLAGRAPRFQLDQIEQQVINGRRGLLTSCTNLENSLDDLKIRIGLPTEQMLNLDLTELLILTSRDELAVNAELINRIRRRMMVELDQEFPVRAAILSAGATLIEQMVQSIELREDGDGSDGVIESLQAERQIWQLSSAKIRVSEAKRELDRELTDESPTPSIIFQRRVDVVSELLPVVDIQSQLVDESFEDFDATRNQYDQATKVASTLSQRFDELINQERLNELPQLLQEVEQLQSTLERVIAALDNELGTDMSGLNEEQLLQLAVDDAANLLEASSQFLTTAQDGGLAPVEIKMDDAMMTALVQRFDLINERGFVADDWRQIKYAADDLKSVLNLRATQSIRTRDGVNRPFDFSFDDSTTTVSGTFDAPFNRRQQRNTYRRSLFNYQAALRRLTQLEDTIKLAVRRDLRSLALEREQYSNDIASAALAYERVVSTELEIRLGVGNVAARDFLEAQTAYISALSNVASRHIDYIVDRMQLFLDLESLTVGDDGFWHELYDESYQPEPFFQLPGYALPAFGCLHPCARYSDCIRYIECAPSGVAMNHRDMESVIDDAEGTIWSEVESDAEQMEDAPEDSAQEALETSDA